MSENKGLLSGGYARVVRNKRYIFWFWLLNLTLAEFGLAAFRHQAARFWIPVCIPAAWSRGFDLGVFVEMLVRPEFGPTAASAIPAICFAALFFVFTVLFLPGVFLGYASNYRLPRDEFFRACGRNLWRFIRLLIVAGIVMGIVTVILFMIRGALVKAAGESTNELLGFEVSVACLLVIFLVMTTLRIWFDLAEADVVLSDQNAVRKSIGVAFRHTFRHLGRLLASYVVTAIVAAIILRGDLAVAIPRGSRPRGLGVSGEPVDAVPAADSAVLAARHRGRLLAAGNDGAHCAAVGACAVDGCLRESWRRRAGVKGGLIGEHRPRIFADPHG